MRGLNPPFWGHSVKRRLFVTIAALFSALVLSSSAALAAPRVTSAASTGARTSGAHACGHSEGATRGGTIAATPATNPATDRHADKGDSDPETGRGGADRPHNHGWYVSQAAHDKAFSGRDHGKHVSEVARSDAGKP